MNCCNKTSLSKIYTRDSLDIPNRDGITPRECVVFIQDIQASGDSQINIGERIISKRLDANKAQWQKETRENQKRLLELLLNE